MAELNRTERLQPSLLDRLTDNAPGHQRETLDQQVLTMAQLRGAVLRDLSNLLNATNFNTTGELALSPLVAASTINYGIPGVAGNNSNDGRSAPLERQVAAAIRAFEPRIRGETLQVRARPIRRTEGLPTLVLEISGELWAQPVPQQIFLETSIELETHVAVITETRAHT